jgi:hypothetical protein
MEPSSHDCPLLRHFFPIDESEAIPHIMRGECPDRKRQRRSGAEAGANCLRATVAYQLSWFDAHMWAYAETNGLKEILSEDFQHGRRYGGVRTTDPFKTRD